MAKKLTKKQQVFCDEYLVDLNQTRAYIAAGYSENGAAQSASALLRNPNVSEYIAKKTGKRLAKLEITADRVLQELAKLAFLDPRKFFNDDGSLKKISELDDETAACLAGIEVSEIFGGEEGNTLVGYLKKVKLADKGINLERLGRYFKLFTDKREVSGKLTLEQLICGADEDD